VKRQAIWCASLFGVIVFTIGALSGQLCAQPIVRAPWYESHVDSTSISIAFATTSATTASISYGPSPAYGTIQQAGSGTTHSVVIPNLMPASQYYAAIIAGTDTVRFVTSTASDYRSSGRIEAYFNRSVDTTLNIMPKANGNADYRALLRDKIAGAQESIDLALYSFSGATADSVVKWLTAAHRRGIAIRVIADSASVHSSSQFHSLTANAAIPAIINSFGGNAKVASNIHHNKFIVFDGRGDDAANAWVLTGSWNLTDQQTTTDYQNAVYLQDLALARAFETEFDQEWGSTGDLPDARFARFSTNKRDITPRTFSIGGSIVHLCFSPNRGAFSGINDLLQQAKRQILFSLLVCTRQDLAATMIAQHQKGIDIHGVVNNTDKSEQTPALRAAGIDALDYVGPTSILLHDKYAIIDAGTGLGAVITGSYNWSLSAEQLNNENCLIIENDALAKLYYQDWLARYHENNGNQSVTLPLSSVLLSQSVVLSGSVFPNPAMRAIHVRWVQERPSSDRVVIYDPAGREVSTSQIYRTAGESTFSTPLLRSAGVYSIVIEHDGRRDLHKVVVIK